jgi:hypothetical protein
MLRSKALHALYVLLLVEDCPRRHELLLSASPAQKNFHGVVVKRLHAFAAAAFSAPNLAASTIGITCIGLKYSPNRKIVLNSNRRSGS